MKTVNELLFIHQGLCGWTFASAQVLERMIKNNQLDMNLRLLSIDNDERLPMKSILYFQEIYNESIQFNNEIEPFKLGAHFYEKNKLNSTIPCGNSQLTKAIISVQTYYPSRSLEALLFFQRKYFTDAIDLNDNSSYLGWFYEMGLDGEYLFYYMNSDRVEKIKNQNIDFIHSLGVTSYPTLVLKNKKRLHIISRGYMPYEVVEQSILDIVGTIEV